VHYSRHRLAAPVAYVTTLIHTRQPITSGLALLAHWSVRQKLNVRISSVQFSCIALYAPWHNWDIITDDSRLMWTVCLQCILFPGYSISVWLFGASLTTSTGANGCSEQTIVQATGATRFHGAALAGPASRILLFIIFNFLVFI